MFHTTFFLVIILSSIVRSANDWSQPCFQGECSYDLPSSDGSVSGSLKIWGSPNAISDITAAGGWTILDCDPNAMVQDIRLVCKSDDTTATGCDHLLNSGSEGKIVRLPENCGKSAFARVAKSWIHDDQSIPSNAAARLVSRAGANPQVRGLSLDTNFAAVDPAKSGNVSIAIQGATIPGANGNLTITPPSIPNRRSRLVRRGILGFIEDAFTKFNSFDKSVTQSLPPVDVNKDFNLFKQEVSCPPVEASVQADLNTKAHAIITVGVAATGTVVPPKLDDFGLFASLDASLDGSLSLVGSASGSIDSGARTLFEVGIPGLDFPGVLSVGPTFKIQGQAKATLDINADMTVDLSYEINGAKLFFPASTNEKSGGGFTPGDTPLKLSVSPSVASKGTVEAHLIPRIDFGIDALGGVAQATVFLNLDASAAMTLSLDAKADASATVHTATNTAAGTTATVNTGDKVTAGSADATNDDTAVNQTTSADLTADTNPGDDSADDNISADGSTDNDTDNAFDDSAADSGDSGNGDSAAGSEDSGFDDFGSDNSESDSFGASDFDESGAGFDDSDPSSSDFFKRASVNTAASASVNGCVDIGAALNVNAGADGTFFGIFDKSTKVNLFSKNFDLFKKCLGTSTGAKRRDSSSARRAIQRRVLSCSAGNTATSLATVADEVLPAGR